MKGHNYCSQQTSHLFDRQRMDFEIGFYSWKESCEKYGREGNKKDKQNKTRDTKMNRSEDCNYKNGFLISLPWIWPSKSHVLSQAKVNADWYHVPEDIHCFYMNIIKFIYSNLKPGSADRTSMCERKRKRRQRTRQRDRESDVTGKDGIKEKVSHKCNVK